MTLDLNWSDVISSDEYQNDLANITNIIVYSIGREDLVNTTNPFVFIIANLCAIQRYFIKNLPQVQDLDVSPFLNLLQKEIGSSLPLTPEFPINQWLKESKSWYGHRGTLAVYPFIADLVNSPLEVDFPFQKILQLDNPNTVLDGAVSETGLHPLPFAQSKLGRIRDGEYWAQFTYVVKVLQAQQLVNLTDLLNLLNNVHPAGTRMFVDLEFKYTVTPDETTLYSWSENVWDKFWIPVWWPTLDNGWTLDTYPGPQLDQHGSGF